MDEYVIMHNGKIFCGFYGHRQTKWVTNLNDRANGHPRFPPAIYTLEEARDNLRVLHKPPYGLITAKIHPVYIGEDPIE